MGKVGSPFYCVSTQGKTLRRGVRSVFASIWTLWVLKAHLFHKCLSSGYCVVGTELGTGDLEMDKTVHF